MSRWEHLDAVVRRWALWANDDRRAAYEHVLGAIRDLKGRGRPTHAAAVSGCTGTGEDVLVRDYDLEDSRHILNVVHRGRPFDALPSCTATTAVLEGVGQ